jgi:hypothetical protein
MAALISEDNTFDALQETIAKIEEEPVKKKPGRPKKVKTEPVDEKVTEINVDEVKEEKKKPKKKAVKVDPEEPSDDHKELINLRMLLQQYANSPVFKAHLEVVCPELYDKKLKKKTQAELKELLADVRMAVANKNTASLGDAEIMAVLLWAERFATQASKNKVMLNGTTSRLFADPNFRDTLEEVKLEYLSFTSLSAKTRIFLHLLKAAYLTHMENYGKLLRDQHEQKLALQSQMPVNIEPSVQLPVPETKVQMDPLPKLQLPEQLPEPIKQPPLQLPSLQAEPIPKLQLPPIDPDLLKQFVRR